MSAQIPLSLPPKPSYARIDYAVTDCNRHAVEALLERGALVPPGGILVGHAASGKSHLASIWAEHVGAKTLHDGFDAEVITPDSAWLVEDIDRTTWTFDHLFHLYNWAKEQGAAVLFTSRLLPSEMDISLPDLRSRLHFLPVFQLHAPDDRMLEARLAKLFADRQLVADRAVTAYILPRIERSYLAIETFVEAIDQQALAENRKLTRDLARRVLESLDQMA